MTMPYGRSYALLAMLAVLLVVPAALAPPMMHDSFWIDQVWSEQFTAALRQGDPYPRWLPASFGGLGAPVFYFYAPLSFHLAGLFGLLGITTYPALLAAFGTAWFGSGLAMHAWLAGRARAPLIGAIVYMLLPYHMIDFYGRGALAEFCAFALVPLVAQGVRTAIERGRAVPLGLAYAALIMTHLPTATIVSILLIAPQAAWGARKRIALLRPVARGAIGGIGGAAIYLVPALTLQRHAALGSLWSVPFLQPVSWSLIHPELWTSASYVLLFAGLALAIALAVGIIAGRHWGFWSTWTVAICVIAVGLVPGFWSLPIVSAVQFPWRSLVLAEFGLATVIASQRRLPAVAAAVLAPLLGFSLLMLDPHNPLHGETMRPLPIPGRQDVIEYLPPAAVAPGRTPRIDRLIQSIDAARARPGSVFPFPSLIARCDEGGSAMLLADLHGALIETPPPGCRVAVKRLPAEWIGLAISALALLALAGPRLLPLVRRRGPAEPVPA